MNGNGCVHPSSDKASDGKHKRHQTEPVVFQQFEILSTIAHSFPFLLHLELNLEIDVANPQQPLRPAATLPSVFDIWSHVFNEIKATRLSLILSHAHGFAFLIFNAGSFSTSHNPSTSGPGKRTSSRDSWFNAETEMTRRKPALRRYRALKWTT